MKLYNVLKIKSKNTIEYIINLDSLNAYDYKGVSGLRKRKFEELSEEEQKESLRKRIKYYLDRKFVIKRTIDCNFDDKSTFLTLTFRENMRNIDKANKEFTLFMKRLKNYLKSPLKYIATWELQLRGAIHYHLVLFSVPYIDNKKLGELWGNGFIKINQIKGKVKDDAIALYITKYLVKDLENKDRKKKAYFCSRNLKKPEEIKELLDYDEINEILIDENDLLFRKEFTVQEFQGTDEKGKKIYEDINKVYIVKKNICKKEKDVLKLEMRQEAQKEVNFINSLGTKKNIKFNSKNFKK